MCRKIKLKNRVLVLGERADKGLIRTGEESCQVEAVFDLPDAGAVNRVLGEMGLDGCEDGQLSMRHVYYTHVYKHKRESLDHILVSEEFYDHSTDPNEWHNLAADTKYDAVDEDTRAIAYFTKVEDAYLLDDYAEGRDTGIVDLLLVGDIDRHQLSDLSRKTERYIERKIRTLVMTPREYRSLFPKFQERPHVLIWEGRPEGS